jgi:hypothetical protein
LNTRHLVTICLLLLSLILGGITNRNQTTISISEPDDIFYTEGTTGNYIEWYVSFDVPLHYSIQRNNTVLHLPSGDLGGNSGNITICVDGLSVGTWYFVLIVDDYEDIVETDYVIVTVYASTYSIIQNPLTLPVSLLILLIIALFVWHERKR